MYDGVELRPSTMRGLHGLSEILVRVYLVRGLLWCDSCHTAWLPLLVPPESLYYVCANQDCPHTALPAKVMEQRVWSRFVSQRASMRQVPYAHRTDVLRDELRRVVIGKDLLDLRLEWLESNVEQQ